MSAHAAEGAVRGSEEHTALFIGSLWPIISFCVCSRQEAARSAAGHRCLDFVKTWEHTVHWISLSAAAKIGSQPLPCAHGIPSTLTQTAQPLQVKPNRL